MLRSLPQEGMNSREHEEDSVPSAAADNRSQYLARSIVVAAVVVAVIVAGATGFALYTEYKANIEATEQRAESNVAVFSEHVKLAVGGLDGVMQAIADKIRLADPSGESFHASLIRMKAEQPILRVLLSVDEHGQIINESRDPYSAVGKDVADRLYFRAHLDPDVRGVYIGPPVVSRFDGKWAMPISRAAHDEDGAFRGVAVASIDPYYFDKAFSSMAFGADCSGFLVHTNGTILAAFPHDDTRIGKSIADSELFSRHLPTAGQGVFQESDPSDGIERIVAYGSVDPWPLVISFSIPKEEALAPFYYRLAVIWAIGTAFVLVVIIYIAHYQIGQARKLAEQTTTLQGTTDRLRMEITERKRAEEALRESEELYRTLFEEALNPIMTVDEGGRYIDANKAALEFLECDRDELLGRQVWDLTPPALLERQERVHAPFVGHRTLETEYLVHGTIKTLLLNVVPLDVEGKTILYGIGQDITERKRAEEALRESEERYRNLFDNTLNGVALHEIVIDAEGQPVDYVFLEVNRAFEQLTGISADKVIGRRVTEVLPGMEDTPFIEIYGRVALTGEPIRFEQYSPPLDRHYAIAAFSPRKGQFAALFENITERVQAEEALRESEEKHRTLFETMAQGVVYQAADGAITSANPAAERVLGLTLDEMQGITSVDPRWRAVHEDGSGFPGETHPSMVALKTGKEVRNVVMGVFNPQCDEYRWIDINAVPQFRPGENTPYQVYITFDDITERKQAEEALHRSLEETAHGQRMLLALSQAAQAVQRARTTEEVYRTVGEGVTGLGYDATICTLTEDRAHLAVSYMTFKSALLQAAERLAGLSAQGYRCAIVPGGIYDRTVSEGLTVFCESTVEVTAESLPRPLRPLASRLVALLGGEQAIHAPLMIGDETVGLLAVSGTGLTEADVPAVAAFANQAAIALENARLYENLRRATEELEQRVEERTAELERLNQGMLAMLEDLRVAKEQAEEADRLKTAFLATVSHELRTPLASIKGFASTLLADDVTWDAESQRDFVETIDREADRLTELIGQLLDMSRLESGTLRIDRQPYHLSDILAQTEGRLRALTAQHRLVLNIALHLPLLNADADRIGNVLSNLVENAAKFAPPGTEITVTAGAEDGQILVSVADEGPGIAPQHQAHVFERFYRVDSEPARSQPGAGLGLPICKGLVEAHGGSIWVQSEPGQGATFFFSLPAA